ncbi:MAG: hypothetical protein GXY08_13495 [Ruminococcus sp.]|nr:hypothetical protein [Ruminococcus sp.]
MSGSKEIGFDILENSDMNSVEEIGTEKMNIDKKARDRMLKITMDKYSEASGRQVDSQAAPEANEFVEQVSGTDKFQHSRLARIIGFAACSAAAVALIAGGMFVYKHNASPENTVSDPAGVIIITTVTEGTTAEPDVEEEETTESEGLSLGIDADFISPNFYTVRTDITQEELNAACKRYLDQLSKDRSEIWDICYAFNDVNHDNRPELFIKYSNPGVGGEAMLVYDGKEYKSARFMSSVSNFKTVENDIAGDVINICPEKSLVYVSSLDRFTGIYNSQIIWLDKNNAAATAFELNDSGYYMGGNLICRPADEKDKKPQNEFDAVYNSYNWQELEYTPYEDKVETKIQSGTKNGTGANVSDNKNEPIIKTEAQINAETKTKTETNTNAEKKNKTGTPANVETKTKTQLNDVLINDSKFVNENAHTNRTDITQAELDAARKRVKENWYHKDDLEDNDMKYAYADVNDDGIPELFIKEYTLMHGYIQAMLVYDGEDYYGAEYYIDFKEYKHDDIDGSYFGDQGGNIEVYGNIMICPEKHLIHLNEGGDDLGTLLKLEKGNIMKTLYKYSYDACYEGGVEVSQNPETAARFQAALDSCSWQELEYKSFE